MSFSHELKLNAAQRKKLASIERRMLKALKEFKDLAVEAGCEQPSLYYECGGSLVCFDEARGDAGYGGARVRQEKVALSMDLQQPGYALDCGAW